MPFKFHCPYCDKDITGQWFGQHIFQFHEEKVCSNELSNILRFPKSEYHSAPINILLEKKLSAPQYWFCLGCMRCAEKKAWTEKHFPACKEEHKKKYIELYNKYKDPQAPEASSSQDQAPVILKVEGWTDEQVNALIGSMMRNIHNYQRDYEDMKRKIDYYEEKVRDLPEETQEEIEESLPEFPDDDDILFDKPEDITALWNVALKMGFPIKNQAILDDYQKWDKMPPKKVKKT